METKIYIATLEGAKPFCFYVEPTMGRAILRANELRVRWPRHWIYVE